MKRKITLLLLLLLIVVSGGAQNSSQGKEFWISFMQNGYKFYNNYNSSWVENTVMISAKRACTGVIRSTDNANNYVSFSVEDNGVTFVDIPEAWAYNENNEEIVDRKAVVLTASDTVSVFISNVATYSFDASFVLPVESLGSEYIIQSDQQSISGNYNTGQQETSSFVIIALEDNTKVEITPSVKTLGDHHAGVPFTVSMSAGQTYFVRSNNESEWRDFSGSSVFAFNGKKLAVFNGNTLTRIPGDAHNGRDHIFEQALPFDSWGRRFVITSSAERSRDIVKITSSGDDNIIYRNGEEIAVIGYGDSFEFDLLASEGSCYIETSEPSVVYVYHTSWEDPFAPSVVRQGDPSMLWIPPVEQRIKEVTFCTFDSEHELSFIEHHYVNIVVHRYDAGRVFLDGDQINAADFQPVAGSNDFCFVRKGIDKGMHHLSCESGLIAHVYGFGEARGYAYCVGANVLTLNGKLYVNGLWSGSYRDGLYMCHDDMVKLLVVANYTVEHVDWTFGDGTTAQGIETSHRYENIGDYMAEAHVLGFNSLTLEPIDDTMSIAIHVGGPNLIDESVVACDSIEVLGQMFDHSMDYEYHGTNIYGCDSVVYLKVDIIGSAPQFEICGNHWPIGGNEFYATESEYSIRLDNSETELDTVIWQIDNPNWRLEPHGKGETCTLLIYTFLLEPVMLHATAINPCDSIHHEFFVQTSYYGMDDHPETEGFVVAPNPTDGQISLHFGDLKGCAEVTVYNALGQKVDGFSLDAGSASGTTYLMPNVGNGLYYFVLRCEGVTMSRKVMLKR